MSSQEGFSVIFAAVGLLILVIILAIVPRAISRSSQANNMAKQIDSINIPAPLQDKTCSSGDGVDSGAQCRYIFTDSGSGVESALKAAGYTTSNTGSIQTFTGGNPRLSINVQIYNGKTTLEATRAN